MISRQTVAVLILFGLTFISTQVTGRRYNLFDPLFADDDSDVHTVSTGYNLPKDELERRSLNSTLSKPEPKIQLWSATGTPSATPPSKRPLLNKSTTATILSTSRRLQLAEPKRLGATAKRQIITSSSATPGLASQDEPIVQQALRAQKQSEQPRHWSALENYYAKLRNAAVVNQLTGRATLTDSENAAMNQRIIDSLDMRDGSWLTPDRTVAKQPPASLSKSPFEFLPGELQYGTRSPPVHYKPMITLIEQEPIKVPIIRNEFDENAQQRLQVEAGLTLPETDLHKLPDHIFVKQQQIRAKHQQDTFGSFDQKLIQEQQQDEATCGPRNLMSNLMVTHSHKLPTAKSQLNSIGEYPSHAGVYNDSINESNFLCSATLIHARFALTLASCVKNPNLLHVRTGEWGLSRSMNETERQKMMISRRVTKVHPFPRYQVNSSEHDLALLEWSQPIDYWAVGYICPACQAQPRSLLRTKSCWAPVRNVTFIEYFDAEGEGETKLRKEVQMVEVPVKLIANDETECKRQTSIEYFNFIHPNYICSGDFRKTSWRAKLNVSDNFGSGIYCNEGGMLSLVSVLQPMQVNSSSAFGFLDLSYYRPWMRNIVNSI